MLSHCFSLYSLWDTLKPLQPYFSLRRTGCKTCNAGNILQRAFQSPPIIRTIYEVTVNCEHLKSKNVTFMFHFLKPKIKSFNFGVSRFNFMKVTDITALVSFTHGIKPLTCIYMLV